MLLQSPAIAQVRSMRASLNGRTPPDQGIPDSVLFPERESYICELTPPGVVLPAPISCLRQQYWAI